MRRTGERPGTQGRGRVAVLLVTMGFLSCSGSEVTDPGAGPGVTFALEAPTVQMLRGTSRILTVIFERTGGFQGPVVFTLEGAPSGVSAEADTVPAAASVAVLHLDVALTAAAGTTALTVQATAPGIAPVTDRLALTVFGMPIPFSGTIFIDPDIITSDDPTTFQTLAYAGVATRTMYDRRGGGRWITTTPYLFDAAFDDGLRIEIQVNPEFGDPDSARPEAEKYADAIGRLPTGLRRDVETVWIHKGVNPFGGGNRNLLIHTGQGEIYEAEGILEETFVHEAAHTSLDATHAAAPGWVAAQKADGTFISTYARDNPQREDVAETYLTYLAVRYRRDRISEELASIIERAIPLRIGYLDGVPLDMYPIVPR